MYGSVTTNPTDDGGVLGPRSFFRLRAQMSRWRSQLTTYPLSTGLLRVREEMSLDLRMDSPTRICFSPLIFAVQLGKHLGVGSVCAKPSLQVHPPESRTMTDPGVA